MKTPFIISPINQIDKPPTTSFSEFIQCILDTLFQTENRTQESSYLTELQQDIHLPPTSLPNNLFTHTEITTIITKLRVKTAPGLDNLNEEYCKDY